MLWAPEGKKGRDRVAKPRALVLAVPSTVVPSRKVTVKPLGAGRPARPGAWAAGPVSTVPLILRLPLTFRTLDCPGLPSEEDRVLVGVNTIELPLVRVPKGLL